MENQQPQKQEQSNFNQLLIMYIDLTFRSLIAFAISITIVLALKSFFDISNLALFIFAFIFSIIISPFFSKIKVAHKFIDKYVTWLNKTFKLENKNG